MFATTLTTERLRLRPLSVDDAPAIYERYASDPVATRYLSWKTNATVEETRDFITRVTSRNSDDTEKPRRTTVWAILIDDDPLAWGTIGVIHRGTFVEMGYVLAQGVWGRGYATEAARAVVAEVWRDEGVWRVEAHCHVDNTASARVLEKCGMRREGHHRRLGVMPQCGEAPQDCYLYAQVRDDL